MLGMSAERVIMHVDMDAFFASVEQLLHPQYRGKPVVVGAKPGKRGVVSAASYEARRYGVHSAMPISTAHSLCPDAIFLPVDKAMYNKYSDKIFTVLRGFSPLVEVASVDEAYLDLTGCPVIRGGLQYAGDIIKKAISDDVGLTASIGIASNKFLAKIASDQNKPDGLTIVRKGEEMNFLAPLKVEKIFGVGKKTVQSIHVRGIKTVGQLQSYTRNQLVSLFGSLGDSLYSYSRGYDSSPVCNESVPKSIGKEITFEEDIGDKAYLLAVLAQLSEDVGVRLRKQSMCASCITLKIRFDSFETMTRCVSFETSIDDDYSVYSYARDLLESLVLHKKVRLIGVTASKLLSDNQQLDLFSGVTKDTRKLYVSLDKIRNKYGSGSIKLAASVTKSIKM